MKKIATAYQRNWLTDEALSCELRLKAAQEKEEREYGL